MNITHEPHGPVSGWTWASSRPHLRAHGLDGELQRIESAVATNYAYDAAGRLTGQHLWSQVSPPQDDTLSQYSLDAVGRLTGGNRTLAPRWRAPSPSPTASPMATTETCGWSHNEGKGVPSNSGTGFDAHGCKRDWNPPPTVPVRGK